MIHIFLLIVVFIAPGAFAGTEGHTYKCTARFGEKTYTDDLTFKDMGRGWVAKPPAYGVTFEDLSFVEYTLFGDDGDYIKSLIVTWRESKKSSSKILHYGALSLGGPKELGLRQFRYFFSDPRVKGITASISCEQ